MNRFEFDFYKELKLPRPVTCGLVNKVTKPKGKRTFNEDINDYYYELNHDLIQVYDHGDGEVALEPGLYWVMDIYKHKHEMHWNHYLIILEGDGSVYPVAEYLDCHNSKWVKKAVKITEAYFNKEELEPIELTHCKTDKPLKKLVTG